MAPKLQKTFFILHVFLSPLRFRKCPLHSLVGTSAQDLIDFNANIYIG